MTVEVRTKGSQWVVKANGRTVSTHRLKKRAVESGRREARKKNTTLRIQRRDGTFQTTRSY